MAQALARKQMGGADAAFLLNPPAASYVRDHARDNIRAIREKERQNRGKNLLKAQAPPVELFKLKQFADAKSRLHDLKPQPLQPGLGARALSEPGRKERTPTAVGNAGNTPSSAGQHRQADNDDQIQLADFEAQVEALKRKHGAAAPKAMRKDENGCPSYLRRMKDDLAEKEHQNELLRRGPDAPPGYRRLPVDEVATTLAALQARREEIEKEFRALPLVIETDGQKRREKAVKLKIEESDKAIKMFSQPVVFVGI